jgi:prolyl oligopeptidase
MLSKRVLIGAISFAAASLGASHATRAAEPVDPYIWLESFNSPQAMDWVHTQNARTLSRLEADPRLKALEAESLAILEAKDRIPAPGFIRGQVYNLWQDGAHKQGLWRQTSLRSYMSAAPQWHVVLDMDALSAADKVNWVFSGADCARQAMGRCLLHLSAGGEDAITAREFDLKAGQFVKGGFELSRSKQRTAWEDKDSLLIVRDWGEASLTTSGYGYVVKRLKRGQPLSAAVELFRGAPADGGYGVSPVVLTDATGHKAELIDRPLSTFESETWIITGSGVKKMGLPLKAQIDELVSGQLIVTLKTDWSPGKGQTTVKAGQVVALDLAAVKKDPEHLKPTVLFSPTARQSVVGIASTKTRLIINWLDNVRGRASVYHLGTKGWTHAALDVPENSVVSLRAVDEASDQAFVETAGFLNPPTLWLADAAKLSLTTAKRLPDKFSTAGLTAEQFEAVSKDGTRVPYFLVHRKDRPLDGSTPTLMTAYGGFDVSRTPFYLGSTGKLWLERGGAYVLANIRGGGEFGPAWHEAGLKTHRQVIYDDFAGVAQDLFKRGVTSPRRLGIQGGSNGGLLMGVQMTQHPDYWNAVIIDVPLLDMLRFEQIAAGTSWVGEYGSVSVPEERAFLASISPYHNLKPGTAYPEPFIFTTTKDDRVGPQHARKFAARMSEMGLPYLFYELTEGGHGTGANLKEKAHTQALEITYLIQKTMD